MSTEHPWKCRDGAGNFLSVEPDGSVHVHVADDWYSGHIDRDTAEALMRELARVLGYRVQQVLFSQLAPGTIDASSQLPPGGIAGLRRIEAPADSAADELLDELDLALERSTADLVEALGAHPRCTGCKYPTALCVCDKLVTGAFETAANLGAARLLAALAGEPICTACKYPAPECRCVICEGDAEFCDCSYHDNARRAERTH